MFFFSLAAPNIFCITQNTHRQIIPTAPLPHISYKFGISHCLLIYEWFYNVYTHFVLSHNIYFKQHVHKRHHQKRKYPSPSLHHLLFLVYISVNVLLVLQIQAEHLPIATLGIIPTTIGCTLLHHNRKISNRPQHMPFFNHYNKFSPSLTTSSNHDKLCYLHAWQSSNSSAMKLLCFSSNQSICIDTGASCCISNNKEDFVNFTPSPTPAVLHGILSGLRIYVPEAPMCLLSPQHMAHQTKNSEDGFIGKRKFGVLTFSGFRRTIYYNTINNLPIIFKTSNLSKLPSSPNVSKDFQALISTTEIPSINNLTIGQRKLLQLHYKLGHINMARIQQLIKNGFLGSSNSSAGTCDLPLCHACIHGKQHRNTVGHTPLDINQLQPGDCISGDQVESSSPGIIPMYKGSPSSAKYHAALCLLITQVATFISHHMFQPVVKRPSKLNMPLNW
jgi:hypothetical protein